jgi:aryl-alcohol dehydrogenase-like predicted oxidoreductase
MLTFEQKTVLGKTGLKAGRLGIASSYGAPAEAFEAAFERGCNYFTLGSFMRGRSVEMIRAIRNITAQGKRDDLIVTLTDYTHHPLLGKPYYLKGLRTLGLDYADVLLLGYTLSNYRRHLIRWAMKMKEEGLVRFFGVSAHNRSLFPILAEEGDIDLFHVRYNAVNTGAEKDVFPFMTGQDRPGIVGFTATRWGHLLRKDKMPRGEEPLTAVDCYRFVLSHPSMDVCMTGARTQEMMKENLKALEMGPLSANEMSRVRRIGEYIYFRGKSGSQRKKDPDDDKDQGDP